jgi:hypothetical protein
MIEEHCSPMLGFNQDEWGDSIPLSPPPPPPPPPWEQVVILIAWGVFWDTLQSPVQGDQNTTHVLVVIKTLM